MCVNMIPHHKKYIKKIELVEKYKLLEKYNSVKCKSHTLCFDPEHCTHLVTIWFCSIQAHFKLSSAQVQTSS